MVQELVDTKQHHRAHKHRDHVIVVYRHFLPPLSGNTTLVVDESSVRNGKDGLPKYSRARFTSSSSCLEREVGSPLG